MKPVSILANKKRFTLRVLLYAGIAFPISFTACFLLLAVSPVGSLAGKKLNEAISQVEGVKRADYIVVLGGSVVRSVDGARLYHADRAPQVVLTGGREDHWSALLICGIPEEVLHHDQKARRTSDHPRTILELPDVEKSNSFILVTNDLHHRRTRLLFEAAGYENVQMFEYQSPDRPDRIGLGPKEAINAMYELAAIIKEKMQGRM